MNAKEYLSQYKRVEARLKIIETEIEKLRTDAISMGISFDGIPTGTGEKDRVARLAVELADYESKFQDEMSALWSIRMEIINTLGRLEKAKHFTLLHKRYIEGKTWEVISVEMGITWRHCHRLHGSALNELEEVINGRKK